MASHAQSPIVGRLAPSPTGGLHLGHARTFLIAWLAARHAQGRIILRIEDLDTTRVRPKMDQLAIDDLVWLGLNWDEGPDRPGTHGPYHQSDRLTLYDEALKQLIDAGLVYPCTCTRAEIARMQSAPHAEDEAPIYPGTCADRTAWEGMRLMQSKTPFAWRLRTPHTPLAWIDRFSGPLSKSCGGDFIVARFPAAYAYQLAVVADDARMGVTQVVRGDDLVTSTPRQLLLYHALGFNPPEFAHVPLAVDATGRRLAKRDQSIKLSTLRTSGIDPTVIVGLLAHSCGWTKRVERSRPEDWVGRADPFSIPRAPWVVNNDAWSRI